MGEEWKEDGRVGEKGAAVLHCEDCSWLAEIGNPLEDYPMYCPDCGGVLDVEMTFRDVDDKKSSRI